MFLDFMTSEKICLLQKIHYNFLDYINIPGGVVLPYRTVILAEDIAPKSNEGCS